MKRYYGALAGLLLAAPASARLGETREQAEERYGLEKPQPKYATPAPLLEGAREYTFEFQGWKIRCALLPAKDGKSYIVREEYRKIWNADVMKRGGVFQIRDFEQAAVLAAEGGAERWGSLPPAAHQPGPKSFVLGTTVYRADDASATWSFGRDSLTLDLPQARLWECELARIKDEQARAAAGRLAHEVVPPPREPPAQPLPPLPVTFTAPSTPFVGTSPARPLDVAPSSPPLRPASAPNLPLSLFRALFPTLFGLGVLGAVVSALGAWLRPARRRKGRRAAAKAQLPPPLPSAAPAPAAARSFRDLDWEEFELLVGEIYRRQGWAVQIARAAGSDGGIDLTLTARGETTLVQCKNWNSGAKVTAKEVREFYGVLVSAGATRGLFVTAGEYTRDAQEFAAGKPLELINGAGLARLVAEAQNDPHDDLMRVSSWAPLFASAVTLIEPVCPFCRASMALRRGKSGAFWGCSTFPGCGGRRGVRRYLGSESSLPGRAQLQPAGGV